MRHSRVTADKLDRRARAKLGAMGARSTKPHPAGTVRNQIRIGGGLWRSRVLAFPDAPGLRPTPDRIRQTLFNWLGQTLHGKTCLDAFAGSGALGFEAASRGAERVVMCEANGGVARALAGNAALLAADQCSIVPRSVFDWLRASTLVFDVVFCDPPFSENLYTSFFVSLTPHLAENALVYVEAAYPIESLVMQLAAAAPSYEVVKSSKAGSVYFGLLRLNAAR